MAGVLLEVETILAYPCAWVHPKFLFSVLYCIAFFFFLRPVSCVPKVASLILFLLSFIHIII